MEVHISFKLQMAPLWLSESNRCLHSWIKPPAEIIIGHYVAQLEKIPLALLLTTTNTLIEHPT